MAFTNDKIESRGAEIFSMMPGGGIGATKLKQILNKWHKTTPENPTNLTHPTVSSVQALHMLQHPERYSKYAGEIFRHIRDLVAAFKMYLVGTAVKAVERKFPMDYKDYFVVTDSPKDIDLEEIETEVVEETLDSILNKLDEVGFMDRVERIADQFEYAFSISLVLGFCPCLMIRAERPPRPKLYTETAASKILDNFLLTIENGLERTHMLDIDEITTDMIITERFGKLKATLLSKPNLEIVELNFNKMFGGGGRVIEFLTKTGGGALSKMMQHEIKHSFAWNESDNYQLERMRKTQLVVGSELSSEAKSAIGAAMRQDVENSSPAQVLEAIKKAEKAEDEMKDLDEKTKVLEAKSVDIMKRIANYIDSRTDALTDKAVRLEAQSQTINEAKRIQQRIEKNQINSERAELLRENTRYVEDNVLDVFGQGESTFGLYVTGSKQQKKDDEKSLKAVQDRTLKQERDDLEKQLKLKNVEYDLLKQDADKLAVRSEAINRKRANLELEVKTRADKEKTLQKIIESRDQLIQDLKKQMEKMRESVKTAAKSSRLSETEREKIMGLVDKIRQTNSFLSQEHQDAVFNQELTRFFEGFNVVNKDLTKIMRRQNFTRTAYEQALSECCVRPDPIFDRIQTKRQLAVVNEWVEFTWMKDTWVNDAGKQRRDEEEGTALLDHNPTNQGPITDSDELYVIDVNPIDDDSQHRLKKYLSDHMELSTHLPLISKRFMSVQFKSVGAVREYMDVSCKDAWVSFIESIFMLSREKISVVGHKIPPRISAKTLSHYLRPFMQVFEGDPTLFVDVIDEIINVLAVEDDPSRVGGADTFSNRLIRRVVKPYISRQLRQHKRVLLKQQRRQQQPQPQTNYRLVPEQQYAIVRV